MLFDEPKVMGILNLTPDSFFEGSRVQPEAEKLIARAEEMISQGAAILDLGAASSRPGAAEVSVQEEMDRLLPAVEVLAKALPGIPLSIDTYRAKVAEAALDLGAALINDIGAGLLDEDMLALAGKRRVPYIGMHMQGKPATMQDNPSYEELTEEVYSFFSDLIARCRVHRIDDLILDPGFGFGKSLEHNFELLARLGDFAWLRRPILIGLSRKRMICQTLGVTPAEALNGSTALHMAALERGAHILRVHDVPEAVQTVKLFLALRQQDPYTPDAIPAA